MVNGNDEGSLADLAYASIRQAILRCDLAPGQYVTEAQLATQFGAGRAAVRAALTRLGHERLVQAIPRRGHQVAPITFQQVRDLFGVRLVLEPAAAQLAATRADEATLAALEELNRACQHRPGDDDIVALRQANNRFHTGLAQASGNERLELMVRTVLDELDRVLYIPHLANVWRRIDSSFEEHERVLDAIRRRDGAAAWQA
ncbi:MAG: GntR family transcriptional regulator, partial [Thermomicrobiales bacterium]|nr:GntR family transcriptional regulator [Thermomicrobiales bacterium]